MTADIAQTSAGYTVPPQVPRRWCASLQLAFARRAGKTAVMRARHEGPLRIQRAFYPEAGHCAHVYLLHPPGGLVVGDELTIAMDCAENAHALVTTPSAGKVYTLNGLRHSDAATRQRQTIRLTLAEGATCEWLPQETIVFNGANADLRTVIDARASSRFCAWDLVCLGRPASGEVFTDGCVRQRLEVTIDGEPRLIERNEWRGGSAMMNAPWGLQGATHLGTAVMSLDAPERHRVDALLEELAALSADHPRDRWSITHKSGLLLARYLGGSAVRARRGFERVWEAFRPDLTGCKPVVPRIWYT